MSLFKKFKMKTAKVPELEKFVGKSVLIPGITDPITIEKICGNVGLTLGHESNPRPQFYEINGEHLIGMLRFHAQMLGDKSIPESDFVAFEEMEFHAEKNNNNKPNPFGLTQ